MKSLNRPIKAALPPGIRFSNQSQLAAALETGVVQRF
jgi:hypothetical protein